MESSSDLKFQFDGRENAEKLFYLYENVLTKSTRVEEKADRLVAHLNAEAVKYYFDRFKEENSHTEGVNSFQLFKKALLETLSTKNGVQSYERGSDPFVTRRRCQGFLYQGKRVKQSSQIQQKHEAQDDNGSNQA